MAKLIGRMRSLSAIVLPGGVAAVIVARTLAVYWGSDWLASTVVVAIGCALAIGLIELFVRDLRLAHLAREFRALPRTADAKTVDTAGPQLSALLRARLDQQPLSLSNDSLTPFLTGLLVMLGLLGTLLGLFQTLHGAGHALTSSADLDALRSGLRAPIAGLTRSFGCAAAGISASAMLGLAHALLRRRETRALRAVNAYVLGPLREWSANARQLRAMEALANQGSALPAAAAAIERVGEKLSEVSIKLIALQQTAIDAQSRGTRDLLAEVRGELSKVAGDTGAALQERVAPLLEELAAQSSKAIEHQSTQLGEIAKNLVRDLEQDAARRRADAEEALHTMRARLDEAEAERAAAHASELATLTRLHADTVADTERRERALAARWQELIERADEQLEASAASEKERLAALESQLLAAGQRDAERLRSLEAEIAAARQREVERMREVDAEIAAAREREAERMRGVEAEFAAVRERELERMRGVEAEFAAARERELERMREVDAEIAAAREREAERVRGVEAEFAAARERELERMREVDAEIAAAREREAERLRAVEAEIAAVRERDAERLRVVEAANAERLGVVEAEVAQARERIAERLRGLDAQIAAAYERDSERLRGLEAQIASAHERDAERLRSLDALVASARERDTEHANQLAAASAQLHAELERLSSALNADLEQRQANELRHVAQVEQTLQQLSVASAAVERGIAQQEGVLEQLVERVSPLFEQATQSSREAAQHALDRIAQSAQVLDDTISRHGSSLEQLVERVSPLFEQAAASSREAGQHALERIEQSARVLDDTIARHGGAVEGLVERVGALLPELASAAQAGAVTTLDRLRTLGEEQAERITRLEAALARERHEHVQGLALELEGHVADIEQRLTRTSGAVEEASAVWRASTVEMQAVAQLFATSVERQREAADAWLESLTTVESAVEQAGRDAASDALSEQLASTHELFARQLQFQHELLTQLRTLRGGASKQRDLRGGQDVSPGE